MTTDAAARTLLRTRQALLLGAVVLCGVWTWRSSGLVGVFEQAQMRLTGAYDAIFAVMFTFLTMFVVCMAISSVVTRAVKRRVAPEEWETVLRTTTTMWDATWKKQG